MSLGINTRVETSSEVPHHSHGYSWCYLLDFFPNHSIQLNQVTWTMFVYFSFQMAPKEEIARRRIGWPCGPRNIAALRDDVHRKELPRVTHCSLCGVRSGSILLEQNVLDISSKLVQLWLQEIFQHFNVTRKWLQHCLPRPRNSRGPSRKWVRKAHWEAITESPFL